MRDSGEANLSQVARSLEVGEELVIENEASSYRMKVDGMYGENQEIGVMSSAFTRDKDQEILDEHDFSLHMVCFGSEDSREYDIFLGEEEGYLRIKRGTADEPEWCEIDYSDIVEV